MRAYFTLHELLQCRELRVRVYGRQVGRRCTSLLLSIVWEAVAGMELYRMHVRSAFRCLRRPMGDLHDGTVELKQTWPGVGVGARF